MTDYSGTEDWTSQYAAQIQALMEQGYQENPNIAPSPQGIVPSGTPGSLVPPSQPPPAEDRQAVINERTRQDVSANPLYKQGSTPPVEGWVEEYANQIRHIAQQGFNPPTVADTDPMFHPTTPGVPLANQGALQGAPPSVSPTASPVAPPAPTATPSARAPIAGIGDSGSSWHDKLQQMLPYIGALAYGSNPKTAHLAQVPLMLGKLVKEGQGAGKAQKQLAGLRENINKITAEEGPAAARQYLLEIQKTGQLDPKVSEQMDAKMEQLGKRQAASQAIDAISKGDPRNRMQVLGELFKTMDPKEASSIATALVPNLQFHNVEGTLLAANPATGEAKPVANVPKTMKIGDLKGGDDTMEELVKLTGGNVKGLLKAMDSDDPELQGQAQQMYAQAVKNAQAAKIDKEDRAEGRKDKRAGAIADSTVRSARILSDATNRAKGNLQGSNISEGARKDIRVIEEARDDIADIRATYHKSFIGPVEGRLVAPSKSLLGKMGEQQAAFRASNKSLGDREVRDRTGAVVSVKEDKEFGPMLPNENDSEAEFKAKLDRLDAAIERRYKQTFEAALSSSQELKPRAATPRYKGSVERKEPTSKTGPSKTMKTPEGYTYEVIQ